MLAGAGLILLGILLRRWTSRYDVDEAVKSLVWAAIWSVILRRSAFESPPAIVALIKDFDAQTTWSGKTKAAARLVAAHGFSQAARLCGAILVLAGVVQIALGYFGR
jgi:hypothetical protein